MSESREEVDHFLTIARLFARIKSDSIAAVFDIVSHDDLHYVVMEHVDGPTLEELVKAHGPLPVEQVLRIAASLVNSLGQMWTSARIVHRNLKSAAIRLDPRGVAKIIDFSLAITAGPDVDATAMDGGSIVGTPCFLSPEQAQGTHTLNTQSDMYALGAVLYHLTTGRIPFEDHALATILSAHIKQQIPPPHRINRSIPEDFSWFLHRLMMKNPNNRYADWDDVLHDVRHLLAGSQPSCVRPNEEYLSTIANDFGKIPDADPQAAPRIRLARKGKNEEIAAYQDKRLDRGHAHDIRRDDLIRGIICWSLLGFWLSLVFWFRAVYQPDPARADILNPISQISDAVNHVSESIEELKAAQSKDEDLAHPPPSSASAEREPPPAPASALSAKSEPDVTPPAAQPALQAGIPAAVVQGLALAFANGNLPAAGQIVRNAPERFKEREALQELLDQIPEPDTLVADYLKSQIGKSLLFEHNGKQRTVTPRSVEDGVIQLEANGRGAEFPIDKLTADEKLRWMDKPQNEARCAAYCLTLMRSSRRTEVPVRAAGCPLLSEALTQALELVPAVTPPAE